MVVMINRDYKALFIILFMIDWCRYTPQDLLALRTNRQWPDYNQPSTALIFFPEDMKIARTFSGGGEW